MVWALEDSVISPPSTIQDETADVIRDGAHELYVMLSFSSKEPALR